MLCTRNLPPSELFNVLTANSYQVIPWSEIHIYCGVHIPGTSENILLGREEGRARVDVRELLPSLCSPAASAMSYEDAEGRVVTSQGNTAFTGLYLL